MKVFQFLFSCAYFSCLFVASHTSYYVVLPVSSWH